MNVLGRQLFKSQRVSLGLLLRSITPALDGFNSNSQLWTSNGKEFMHLALTLTLTLNPNPNPNPNPKGGRHGAEDHRLDNPNPNPKP